MALAGVLPALGHCGATLASGGLQGADTTNGLFGSVVAVTGDAHQAQVAQDIFRQEVRIERSLRVREDIRDAHKLMIENVQTQLLMGNIVLGICFAVLIEGRPSDPEKAPVLVQELWAIFAVWAVSLSFLSVWFALQFQNVVSLSARKRLLEKHRICTPNDEVVGRMGGLTLAEKVSQLHQSGLNQLSGLISSTTGYESFRETAIEQLSKLEPLQPLHLCSGPPPQGDLRAGGLEMGMVDAAQDLPLRLPLAPQLPSRAVRSAIALLPEGGNPSYSDEEIPELFAKVSFDGSWPTVEEVRRQDLPPRQRIHGKPVLVRSARGVRAWFDGDTKELSSHYIVDLPDFLVDETLVRCSWSFPERRHRRSVRLAVQGEANLYVAALSSPQDQPEAFRGQGPPPGWSQEELPVLCGASTEFQRVEGFSILLSEPRKLELPIYRAPLAEPDSTGWCKIKLTFEFKGRFEAPILILRRGRVLTAEEDWPVREFLNELEEVQPLREHSLHYMGYGLMNLILAAAFAHLGRVLTDRPWPSCEREVIVVFCAFFPALIFALQPETLMNYLFNLRGLPRKFHETAASAAHATRGLPSPDSEAIQESRSSTPSHLQSGSSIDADLSKSRCSFDAATTSTRLPSSQDFSAAQLPKGAVQSRISTWCSSAEEDALVGPGLAQCLGQSAIVDAAELVISPQSSKWGKDFSLSPLKDASPIGFQGTIVEDLESCSMEAADSSGSKSVSEKHSWRCQGWCKLFLQRWPCLRGGRLNVFSKAVKLLWLASILGIVTARTLFHGRPGGLHASERSAEWSEQEVSWPTPFFAPTAAVLAADGTLWIASDWLLVQLSSEASLMSSWRLPVAARGLLLAGSEARQAPVELFVASDTSILRVDALQRSGTTVPDQVLGNTLGPLLASQSVRIKGSPMQLPVDQLGPTTVATSALLPGSGADIVLLAPKAGGVAICAPEALLPSEMEMSQSGAALPRRLQVAAKVPQNLQSPRGATRALHLCPGGGEEDHSCGGVSEPVLWSVEDTGWLIGFGLESGRVLAAQSLPWSLEAVALAGNATHLIVIAAATQGAAPRVFSSRFQGLLMPY